MKIISHTGRYYSTHPAMHSIMRVPAALDLSSVKIGDSVLVENTGNNPAFQKGTYKMDIVMLCKHAIAVDAIYSRWWFSLSTGIAHNGTGRILGVCDNNNENNQKGVK